jgi:protein gp37
MGEKSKIEWCHHTFNPWIGCQAVSPGCNNCYAEAQNAHWNWTEWGRGKPRKRTSPSNWHQPLRWAEKAKAAGTRERVFCASLADVLDPTVPPEWLEDLIRLVLATNHSLDWLFLSKREKELSRLEATVHAIAGVDILPGLWVGVSAENQAMWDRRVPKLLEVNAVVRFVSCEPLLDQIIIYGNDYPEWVIVGGESGPHARPIEEHWVLSLQSQCRGAGTAVLFKQWGGPNKKTTGRLLRGQLVDEYPTPYAIQPIQTSLLSNPEP